MDNAQPDPMLPRPYRVQRVQRETHDIFTLDLVPAREGEAPPSFLPGQFNMLYVFGVGEVAISISGDPANTNRVTHTVRAVGAVTRALQRLRQGDSIGIRGPFGKGWPVLPPGHDIVAVTGGLGLVPLRPLLYQLLSRPSAEGKVTLLHGNRTPSDIPFRKELSAWAKQGRMDVQLTVDRGTPAWKGRVGVVTRLIERLALRPEKTLALICGPEIMMRFAVAELQKCGVAGTNLYLAMERNMKCAVGLCGLCQFGPHFVCKDGPVFRYDSIGWLLYRREI